MYLECKGLFHLIDKVIHLNVAPIITMIGQVGAFIAHEKPLPPREACGFYLGEHGRVLPLFIVIVALGIDHDATGAYYTAKILKEGAQMGT